MLSIAVGTSIVRIHRGNITMIGRHVGAIVNPANEDLRPSGGICGEIHEFGGPEIAVECIWIGKLATGRAVATTAGRLLADYVIHTVGPFWQGGGNDEDRMLAACYRNCLDLAAAKNLRSVAFPSISTGSFGFPTDRAAAIAIGTSTAYLRRSKIIEEVILVAHNDVELFALEGAADRWVRMQAARAGQPHVVP